MIRILLLVITLSFAQTVFSQSTLSVGLSATDITPHVDDQIPLGGYGGIKRRNWPWRLHKFPFFRYFRVAQGDLDPIRVKAMFLEKDNSRLLFVSLDVIGVTKDMHKDLYKRLRHLGIKKSHLLVSGTHTHSGPGALSRNTFWEAFAMDTFQRKFYKKFLNNIVKTVETAIKNAKPAELYTLTFGTEGLQRNRRGSDRPLDRNANLLMAQTTDGEWLGGIVNYAVHGTSLGDGNYHFSADAPGAIERELEALLLEKNGIVRLDSNPAFLFINGAQGDVSPGKKYLELGKSFAEQASANWNAIAPLEGDWKVSQTKLKIGSPRVNLQKCVEASWMPKFLNLGIRTFISPWTVLTKIKLGPLWLMTWPGEATVELGQSLVADAKEAGAQDAWILGLTNDHLAYFTTPHEYEEGGYETCVNFFGGHGGETIIKAYKQLSIWDGDSL